MPDYLIYGGEYRGDCPKEADEQATFIKYLRTAYPQTYGAVVVHVENEGKRTYRQAQHAKNQGQNKGASDILIPVSHPFVCELKRKDRTKSRASDEQIKYLNAASKMGSFACIAYAYDAALQAFTEWKDFCK